MLTDLSLLKVNFGSLPVHNLTMLAWCNPINNSPEMVKQALIKYKLSAYPLKFRLCADSNHKILFEIKSLACSWYESNIEIWGTQHKIIAQAVPAMLDKETRFILKNKIHQIPAKIKK